MGPVWNRRHFQCSSSCDLRVIVYYSTCWHANAMRPDRPDATYRAIAQQPFPKLDADEGLEAQMRRGSLHRRGRLGAAADFQAVAPDMKGKGVNEHTGFSGSLVKEVRIQTTVSLFDISNHELKLVEVRGLQNPTVRRCS